MPVASPTQANASSAGLRFLGASLGDYALNLSAPGAISEVPDPAGGPERVLEMTVDNDDVYPVTPTDDPRAQLQTPTRLSVGSSFWWRAKFFLPRDFPKSVPGWLVVLEGPYGPPFDGTPPWHVEINQNHIQWGRNSTYDWDVPWQMPLVRDQWVNVLMHCRFAEHGFVEMWVDGERVRFFGGDTFNPSHHRPTRRLLMRTRDSSNDGGTNFAVVMNYRERNMFNSVTVYQGETAVGPTFASVSP